MKPLSVDPRTEFTDVNSQHLRENSFEPHSRDIHYHHLGYHKYQIVFFLQYRYIFCKLLVYGTGVSF